MRHVDEGTIHAWLDGALPPEEHIAVEEHVATCESCAANVAEARGFIAASARILSALDDVPLGAIPGAEPASMERMTADAAYGSAVAPRGGRWSARRFASIAAVIACIAVGVAVRERMPERRPPEQRASGHDEAPARTEHVPAPSAVQTPRTAQTPSDMRAQSVAPTPRGEARSAPLGAKRQLDVALDRAARGGATAPATAAPAATIHGRVTDASSGRPLPQAVVAVSGTAIASVSDTAGGFTLKSVPPGSHSVTARHIGFAPESARVHVNSGTPTTADIRLPRAPLALGEVVIAGASVGGAPPERTIDGLHLVSSEVAEAPGGLARRSVYELRPGVLVVLTERQIRGAYLEQPRRAESAASGATSATESSIRWTSDAGTEMILSGPLAMQELEEIRHRVR